MLGVVPTVSAGFPRSMGWTGSCLGMWKAARVFEPALTVNKRLPLTMMELWENSGSGNIR